MGVDHNRLTGTAQRMLYYHTCVGHAYEINVKTRHSRTCITRAYPLSLTFSYHICYIAVSAETQSKCNEDRNHVANVIWWSVVLYSVRAACTPRRAGAVGTCKLPLTHSFAPVVNHTPTTMSAMLCPIFANRAPWDQTHASMWGFCELWCLYEATRSFLRVPLSMYVASECNGGTKSAKSHHGRPVLGVPRERI
jgi:hypothetical protein